MKMMKRTATYEKFQEEDMCDEDGVGDDIKEDDIGDEKDDGDDDEFDKLI